MRIETLVNQYYRIFLLLLFAGASCTSNQPSIAKLLTDPANGFVQVKKNNNNTIVLEILPPAKGLPKSGYREMSFLRVKLTLRSKGKIKSQSVMQYLNFGIKNSFYAVQGTDTLPCIICERIPGIAENEFLYITFFHNPVAAKVGDTVLRILVADTIAGFGTTDFKIKNAALKNWKP